MIIQYVLLSSPWSAVVKVHWVQTKQSLSIGAVEALSIYGPSMKTEIQIMYVYYRTHLSKEAVLGFMLVNGLQQYQRFLDCRVKCCDCDKW